MRLRTLSCMIVLSALPALTRAQDAVPVHREPRHRLALDSARYRVLDVQIPAGDTTRFHIHDTAILYVAIGLSRTTAQIIGHDWAAPSQWTAVGVVRIDSAYAPQPVTHRVANPGPGVFRLLAITSSGATHESAIVGPRALPGTVELRSSSFQQARVELPPGSATEWVTSPSPVLVVQPSSAGLVVQRDGGARHALEGAGGWALVPARARYRISNGGPESATAVAVQIS